MNKTIIIIIPTEIEELESFVFLKPDSCWVCPPELFNMDDAVIKMASNRKHPTTSVGAPHFNVFFYSLKVIFVDAGERL